MPEEIDFSRLYAGFDAPVVDLDCGARCAPFNGGVPVCCDTRHSVPTAYHPEWVYLQANTDLWHLWAPEDRGDFEALSREAGPELVLIECLGADRCQRNYRSLVCRAFPFFPYVDSAGQFLGLSYYWEYEDRCWVLSNLASVTPAYLAEFVTTYEAVFRFRPDELETFRDHAAHMRDVFLQEARPLPLLHRDGHWTLVNPQDETATPADPAEFIKHGPFEIADSLRFPDEI